jgi:hypothetical protein
VTDERTSELFAAARGLGIQTEYWDVEGGHHEAGVDALLAVMAALGVDHDGLDDAPGAARRFARAAAGRLPGPLVAWGEADLLGTVVLPSRLPDRIRLVLELEDGERRVVDLVTADLPLAGPGPDGGRGAPVVPRARRSRSVATSSA